MTETPSRWKLFVSPMVLWGVEKTEMRGAKITLQLTREAAKEIIEFMQVAFKVNLRRLSSR